MKKTKRSAKAIRSDIKTQVVVDQNYLETLLHLLSRAKTKIDILSFSFAIGSAGGKLNATSAPMVIANKLVELKKKHGRELTIRFYVEGERETADRNSVTAEFLKRAGVKIKYGATHAKGFSVDDRYVFFGSTNLTNQSIMKNNEANLLIDSKKVAAGFKDYFEHLWAGGRHGEIELDPPLIADGGFKEAVIEMIDGAKKTVEFSIYFFNHREIEKALIRAHDRGVRITGFVHQHASFAMSYIRRNFRTVRSLKSAGIEEIYFSQPHTFSHSKYLVVDRREIALGTGNWLVEDVEIHPQLYIRLQDSTVAKALVAHLKKQIRDRSAEPIWG